MTTTTELARPEDIADAVGVPVGALAIRADQTEPTEAQRKALGHIGLQDCPPSDVAAFFHLCQRTGLDPWARQIYLIERREKKNDQWISKWQPQTGIDGFRVIAQRSGHYAGQDPPQWCGPDGEWVDVWLKNEPPAAARVRVWRDDKSRPFEGTAVFREYAQYTGQGQLTSMWKTKSSLMIAKCARALAFREAFPQDMSGLYIAEEVDLAEDRLSRRTRVQSHRDGGPVQVGELTGQAAPPPATPEPAAAGDSGIITRGQLAELLPLLRASTGPTDGAAWVTAVLGRPAPHVRELTSDEADLLMGRLRKGPPPGGWEGQAPAEPEPAVESEVVDQPAAASADADDDHADEYAQLEAERDAARGDA